MFSRANPFDESVSKFLFDLNVQNVVAQYYFIHNSRCNKRKSHCRKLGAYLGRN